MNNDERDDEFWQMADEFIKLANQITGEGSEWVRRPRLTLIGEERERVTAVVEQAIAARPNV